MNDISIGFTLTAVLLLDPHIEDAIKIYIFQCMYNFMFLQPRHLPDIEMIAFCFRSGEWLHLLMWSTA